MEIYNIFFENIHHISTVLTYLLSFSTFHLVFEHDVFCCPVRSHPLLCLRCFLCHLILQDQFMSHGRLVNKFAYSCRLLNGTTQCCILMSSSCCVLYHFAVQAMTAQVLAKGSITPNPSL